MSNPNNDGVVEEFAAQNTPSAIVTPDHKRGDFLKRLIWPVKTKDFIRKYFKQTALVVWRIK